MAGQDVSSAVSDIVGAFKRCRVALKEVRARKAAHLRKKRGTAGSADEARLNGSLVRAPVDIEDEYTRGVRGLGDAFKRGDGLAQTLLQTTLAKVNSGLADIVSASLVSRDPNKRRLDYRSLAVLADALWSEAKGSLVQLGQRLSWPAIPSTPETIPGPYGLSDRTNVGGNNRGGQQSRTKPTKAKASPPERSGSPKEYVAGVKQDNQIQWAIVRARPQKKRFFSGSSTSLTSSNSSASAAANSTSTGSATLCNTPTSGIASRQFHPDPLLSPASQNTHTPSGVDLFPAGSQQPVQRQSRQPVALQRCQPHRQSTPLPLRQEHVARVPLARQEQTGTPVQPPITRRRPDDRPTESFYSFASDSTKIGEIPMHRWPTPWDYEAMERLNAQAAGPVPAALVKPRKKRVGILARMFGKPSLDPISEA